MTAHFFIGNWVSIDSVTGTIMSLYFKDNEYVTTAFQNERHDSKYTLHKEEGLIIMTFTNTQVTSKFVIMPKGDDAFLLYMPKEYERMQQAGNATPGMIAWGWSRPVGIEFIRRTTK